MNIVGGRLNDHRRRNLGLLLLSRLLLRLLYEPAVYLRLNHRWRGRGWIVVMITGLRRDLHELGCSYNALRGSRRSRGSGGDDRPLLNDKIRLMNDSRL